MQKTADEMYHGTLKMSFIHKYKRVKCSGHGSLSRTFDEYDWTWPFVDIQFMRSRKSGLFLTKSYYQDMDRFYKNVCYQLHF